MSGHDRVHSEKKNKTKKLLVLQLNEVGLGCSYKLWYEKHTYTLRILFECI